MKRHGYLFGKITEIDNIRLAYKKARKGKGWQDTVKRFDKNLEDNLKAIQNSLIDKTFTTSNYTEKTIHEPKKRIIYKLPFSPDRIVQHAIMNIIEPIWNNLMIYDSYSCRTGKGIHAASRRTMEYIKKVNPGYCLQMDISKFYPSINHDILFKIIQKKIKCKDTLDLLENIINSMPGNKNVPIGNYTSQWFGNLYMHELDEFLKQEVGVKHYIRYCDDFILLHKDKTHLHELAVIIKEFITQKLDMSLSQSDIFPLSHGIDFVGYRHFPKYVLVRKSTAKRIKHRLQKLPHQLETGEITSEQHCSTIASTLGWLKWSNSHNLRQNLDIDKLWGEIHIAQ
jgi:retron-type reverse transcriptase